MRRRITRTLFTAAAAGVTVTTLGFAAAGPAGAASVGRHATAFTPNGTVVATNANCSFSTVGLPADNCGKVGYQASGRTFRFAQAKITVPNHAGSLDSADPALYVALDNSGTNTWQYTRVGIAPCPASAVDVDIVPNGEITCPSIGVGNTSGWVVFAATSDSGNAPSLDVEPLSSATMGDGILVNVYLPPTGNSVLTTITLPDGTTYNNAFPITGPVYTNAQAVADWTTAIQNDDADQPQPAVPSSKIRDAQFFDGRFTTVSGAKGTFSGPWTLDAFEATSNGSLPPTGTLIGQPSYLWNDGNGINGKGDDAFGVWRFPF
jgi:hypothetical protein